MNIVAKIEKKLVDYLEKPYRDWPRLVYLGEDECSALDKHFGGIVQDIFHAEIVMVMKRNFIEFGD